MTKQIELDILGERRILVFNNFARVEIAKHIRTDAVEDADLPEPIAFIKAIERLHEQNSFLLLKTLVYAGHCGDCYRRQNVTDLTLEDIGEWIAEASDAELYQVFNVFLEAEGIGLPPDTLPDDGSKKKPKRGRKSSSSRSVKSA